jgi:hypothetical protein
MPLISKLNFFHVHNPRCGGTSLNSAFYHAGHTSLRGLNYNQCDMSNFYGIYRPRVHKIPEESRILELDHLSISQVLSRLSLVDIKTLHFISIVRHPWQRCISEYKRKLQRNDNRFIKAANTSFSEYLERLLVRLSNAPGCFDNQFQSAHFWPQHLFADFASHPDIVSFSVLRLENLDSDWSNFQSKWNFLAPLKRNNSNATRRDDSQLSDAEISDIQSSSLYSDFQKFYKIDYELFGYQ